ncbi:MAG: prolipoprotein diacylglyceryl transferase [Acidobacteria bacterium]|nr:prolipoprotein diacylglyceryl transferase [Acidobacteriota bacterium]
MFPRLLQLGPFTLYSYGLLVAQAFLVALFVASRLAERSGIDRDRVTNLGVAVAIAGIVGAKVLLVVSDFSYYARNPGQIFSMATLQAGGVFFGGLAAALATAFWYMRRWRLPALRTADAFAPALALGHAIGRLGCFLAGCCWGRPSSVPWAVTFTRTLAHELVGVPLGVAVHPTQLYEAAAELIVFAVLWVRFRRPHPDGAIIGLYLVLYSAFRFAIEFFRDRAELAYPFGAAVSLTQWAAVALAACGIAILFRRRTA